MRTKTLTIATIFIILFNISSFSQESKIYEKCHIRPEHDVKLELPTEGFKLNNSQELFGLSINQNFIASDAIGNSRVGSLYAVAFNSINEDGMILFPLNMGIPLRDTPKAELQAAYANESLNCDSLITVIAQKDMSQYCNADTALIYQMKLPEKFLDKYTTCIGIYLIKYAHPDLFMKVMLTDNGLPNAEKYLHTLLNCVYYGNSITPEGIKAEQAKQEKFNSEHGPCIHIKQASKHKEHH